MNLDDFMAATPEERLGCCSPDDGPLVSLIEAMEAMVARDATRAVDASVALAACATDGGKPSLCARSMRAGATAHAYLGKFDVAIEHTSDARKTAAEAGDRVEAARALVARMQPLCETGKIDDAIAAGETAREELLAADRPLLAARVDLNLGNVHKARGDAEQALEHLKRVTSVLPVDDPIQPHALNAVGECLYVLDDHKGADEAFVKAAARLGNNGGLAGGIIGGNRADVAAREGRLQDAIDLFRDAREVLEAHAAHGHSARLRIEMAEALEHSGLHAEALVDLEEAIPLLLEHGLPFEAARGRFAAGRIYLRNRRYDQALEFFHAAQIAFTELGNTRLANAVLLGTVEACLALNRLDEATVRLELVARQAAGPYDEALVAHHQACLHEAAGNIQEACEAASQAVEHAAPLNIKTLNIDLLAHLSWLQRKAGAVNEAIESGRKAVEQAERVREGFHGHRLRAAFLAAKLPAHEAYVTALLDTGDADRQREAFDIVERARSRALVERLMQHLGSDASRDADDEETKALRRRLNALYTALAEDGLDNQRRLSSPTRQADIDRLEIELDRRLAERQAATPSFDDPVALDEVARVLPKGTALVEYFVSRGEIAVFTIFEGQLEVKRLGTTEEELDRLVCELHFQCRRRLRGNPGPSLDLRMQWATEAILKELSAAIVEPLPEAVRRASRWMVVPHGPLVAVPFHALSNGESCLIDQMEISTAPSAAVAIRLANAEDRGEGILIATVGDDLAPSIRAEGDAVEKLHASATRLDDSDATADRVRELLSTVRIAHIACHGRFLPGSPRSSGLRLADRWLTVRDVHELPSAPSIVVLSGCETGLYPRDGANELLGLTHGFAAGGTRAVVASLWSVHDEASTELMTTMHEWIARGETSVTTALRRAQLALREVHPHPAFWAAFFCTESQVRDRPVSRGGASQ